MMLITSFNSLNGKVYHKNRPFIDIFPLYTVSIPFKREGVSQAQQADPEENLEISFNSLQTEGVSQVPQQVYATHA